MRKEPSTLNQPIGKGAEPWIGPNEASAMKGALALRDRCLCDAPYRIWRKTRVWPATNLGMTISRIVGIQNQTPLMLMSRLLTTLYMLTLASLVSGQPDQGNSNNSLSIEGRWLTHQSIVRVEGCESGICGFVEISGCRKRLIRPRCWIPGTRTAHFGTGPLLVSIFFHALIRSPLANPSI